MSPFSRFVAQADGGLADLVRRSVESMTVPLRVKSQDIVAELTRTVAAAVKTILIKSALALFAAVMALTALGFALAALHGYLALVTGPIEATLIMAGVFALLAIAGTVTLLAWPKASRASRDAVARAQLDARQALAKAQAASRLAENGTDGGAPGSEARQERTTDMADGLGAIATALGEAGFRREQAGLRAGLALAEQLRPAQLVSLALIGGFIAGARLVRRR